MLHEAKVAATDAARLDALAAFPLAAHRQDRPAVPGQHDVRAAWLKLPAETRDRIGTLAVEHTLQMFVAYVLCPPEDLATGAGVCGDALVAADDTLEELTEAIEAALPELFGPADEHPAWAIEPGRAA